MKNKKDKILISVLIVGFILFTVMVFNSIKILKIEAELKIIKIKQRILVTGHDDISHDISNLFSDISNIEYTVSDIKNTVDDILEIVRYLD